MRCIVTAGPTYEPLDQVRRLTNFSTGRLGATLAAFLAEAGHEVLLLRGALATSPLPASSAEVRPFTTTEDLRAQLQAVQSPDAIFHAAAVSDFAPGKVYVRALSGELMPIHDARADVNSEQCRKLSTREGSLLAELVPTPKILPRLREWHPKALIVGWKYEADGTPEDAIRRGMEQMQEAKTNACVVNGPAYGTGFGMLVPNSPCQSLAKLEDLCRELARLL